MSAASVSFAAAAETMAEVPATAARSTIMRRRLTETGMLTRNMVAACRADAGMEEVATASE
jgi:hypothetical protein